MTDTVRYERRGPIAFVTLHRPDSANAQDRELTYNLDDAFVAFS